MGAELSRETERISTSAIKSFLDRYRKARVEQREKLAKHMTAGLVRLRVDLAKAKELNTRHIRQDAPAFNILRSLGVERKEFVHSNFLADLLDPTREHGQGTLFLASFLALCDRKRGGGAGLTSGMDDWADSLFVQREAPIFKGRFDLLLHAHGRLCVIIENKITKNKIAARQGEAQLPTYRDWLAKRPEPAAQKVLVFLTIERSVPKGIGQDDYVNLTYRDDIKEWLEQCRPNVAASVVGSFVDQYLRLIAGWSEESAEPEEQNDV